MRALVFFSVAFLGAGLDLATKHLAFQNVPEWGEVTVVDGFFSIGRTMNHGVVFGKFGGAPKLWLVVSVLAVPAITAIFLGGKRPKPVVQTISLGMILAGTIGNMVDRIAFGAVRDFIKFYNVPGLGTWPLFNLADSFICVGVFLLSVEMIFFDERKRKEAASPAPAAPGLSSGEVTASAGPPAGAS